MQYAKSGNKPMTIIDIKRNKKKQIVVCFTDEEIVMSENVFSSFLLYKGKTLSPKEIKNIKETNDKESLYNYALSSLNRGSFSVNEMKAKLLKRCDDSDRVDEILFSLTNIGLLDDKQYAIDYAEMMGNKLYGKQHIINKLLHEKRISKPYVDSLKFKNEKAHAEKAIALKEKSYASLPYKQKRNKLNAYLERRGYERSTIEEVLSSIKENPKEVQKRLLNEAEKAKKRYSRKYSGYDLKQKIYSFLQSKGYSNNDISQVLERIKL